MTAITQLATRVRQVSKQHGVLVKNSSAVIFGQSASAVLGFVYWWAAARSFSPEIIGTASALISLMAVIGLIGEGGIGTLLTGEIIQRQPIHRSGLISAAIISGSLLSFAIGIIALFLSIIVSGFFTTLNPTILDYVWMLIGCVLTANFLIVNKSFIGMLQSQFYTLHQFLFSIFKLALIVLVALWLSSEAAILFSWVISLLASLLVVELCMRRTGKSLIHRPDFKLLYTLKQKAAHHYLLDLSSQTQILAMPYLVAVLLSTATNAVFTVTWMVVVLAAIIPGVLSTVIFPVIQAAPEEYRNKMTISLSVSTLFGLGFGLLIYFYSTDLLAIFNPVYAKIGGSELRFLGFGVIGHAIKSHIGSAARLNNRMRQVAVLFTIAGIFEVICVIIGSRINGLEGVSIGWVLALSISGIVMMVVANPFRQSKHD